tara:strand:- start:668 stop:832 length:165 start_codon:yes stop_codon:yes gene_type:complete
MELNLFFLKLSLLSWDEPNGKKFGIEKKGRDTVITIGRHDLWVIPRNSNSFFQL